MKNIVVFASGSGTNFQAILDAIEAGKIENAQISGLITNKSNIGAIDRADHHQIPVHVINREAYSSEKHFAQRLLEILKQLDADLIVLAGYLKKIPSRVIQTYERRIINIHPALLPKYGGKGYYGMKVHQAVIDHGDEVTGCTVHYVTEEYDEGPIIEQRQVRVFENDTADQLAERVLKEEHKLLPTVINKLIDQNR